MLQLLRDVKGVDVVFVADMTECGRHLAYGAASASAGRHIHSRIVSGSGKVYGMLCCISPHGTESALRVDQRMLRHTAALTAAKIEKSLGAPAPGLPPT